LPPAEDAGLNEAGEMAAGDAIGRGAGGGGAADCSIVIGAPPGAADCGAPLTTMAGAEPIGADAGGGSDGGGGGVGGSKSVIGSVDGGGVDDETGSGEVVVSVITMPVELL